MKTASNTESESPLNIALVGCGNVARKHVRAMNTLNGACRVVGSVDPDRSALRETSRTLEVPGFERLEALLAEHQVDLVTLATPTGLHPGQAVAAAEAGAHVLTEKPLGTCLDEARSMVRRLAELDRRLFVVKQLRHHPLFRALRDAIEAGRFGQLHTIGMQIFWTRPQSYYDAASWRGTRELDGGALMNQASHYVDLLDWLFGPVAEVHALGDNLGRRIEVEDTAVVTLKWKEGFIGSLHVTMLAYPNNVATSLTVVGERGTVRLGGPLCDQIEAWNFSDASPADDSIEALARQVPDALQRGHEAVYRNVLASLGGRRNARVVDGDDGLRSLAIIDAAYRAMEAGTSVDVAPPR